MQRLSISTTLFLMTYLCYQNNIATADIITPPASLNTTLNSTAVFTCAVANALTIYWTINGSSTASFSEVDVNVEPMSGGDSFLSTLLIPADVEYNQSSIVCGAVLTSGNDPVTNSNPVLLLIQGVLEPVTDLSANITNNSTIVTAQWTPPYSLDNVPINYTVTVTGQLSGYSSSRATSDLSYTVQLPDLCDNYLLTVMAGNGAGYSNNNTIVIYKLEDTHVLLDSVEATITIPSPGAKPEAVISFNVTHSCSIPLSHSIAVSLNNDANTPLSVHGPYYTNSTNEIITLTLTELTEDTLYHMTLWDKTTADTISNPVPVNISSYDVQDVSISVDDSGVLCVSCYFMVGSEAGGCVIELTADTEKDPDFLAIHLLRKSGESVISGCIQSLVPGYYLLNIYDAEEGGFKLPDAMPALTRVGVPVMPRPLVTSSTSSSLRAVVTSTMVPQRRSTSVETSPSVVNDRSASFQPAEITYRNAAIGVGVVIIVVIMVLIALIAIQIRKLKQKRKRNNTGIIAEDTNIVHFEPQISCDTAVTYASSTPSPPIETISPDEEAPPPPPPPSSSATLPLLRTVPSTTSVNSDRRHSHTYSDNLQSPGAESMTSFTSLLRSESMTNGQRRTDSNRRPRPSSYHEPSINAPSLSSDHSRRYDIQQGALNRTRGTCSLRPTGVMTAWAAVNPLTLPVLPEAPPPYDEIERDSTSYQRPQSALVMSSNTRHVHTSDDSAHSSVVSELVSPTTNLSSNLTDNPNPPPPASINPSSSSSAMNPSSSIEYITLDLMNHSTSDNHLPLSNGGGVANGSSSGSLYSGSVQYAIISNSNTFISSHDRLSSIGNVTNSLV